MNLMKFILVVFLLTRQHCFAFNYKEICGDSLTGRNNTSISYHKKNSINIYVISKDKYFDIINRVIVLQARIASVFHRKKLKVIMAHSTADAEKKIEKIVNKHDAVIGTLWFDSHGKYRKGYSSFMVGSDEYDYKNINAWGLNRSLKKIAAFCDSNTNIGIGSCYAAADYSFPVIENGEYHTMGGDSLLRGMGNIFRGSYVYACKSWVMAKPGMFGKRNALAGFPLDKEYKDSIFIPVWNSMGVWKRYSSFTGKLETINTIYLSASADILIQNKSYLSRQKAQRKLKRNLKKLRNGLYNLKV